MARKNKNNPYYKYVPTISVRRIIHHICAFVLTMLIFLMAGSLSAVTGFLNNSAIKHSVESQEFYKSIRESIIAECQSIAISSDIDENVFYKVITTDTIARDIQAYTEAGIKGKYYEFDVSELQQTMADAIEESLQEKGVNITSSLKKDIGVFCKQAMNIYCSSISISYIDSYAKLKGTAKPIAVIVSIVSFILILALLFFMVAIYRFKVVHKTIRMFAYALGGSGLMLTGLFTYCKVAKIGRGLQILPEFLYNAMQTYIQYGLNTFIFAGVLLIIFSLTLAFVSESLRVRVKKNHFARLEANFRESLNEELENKNFTPDLDMTNREEQEKKIAHDEFNRYAMDRLDNVTLNEEREAVKKKQFDLPAAQPKVQDDFTEVQLDDDQE